VPLVRNRLGFSARVGPDWSPAVLVYAITDLEAVKIGKCTGHPRERLAQLQTGSSRELHLLSYDGRTTEAAAHKRLAPHRVRGEWFAAEPCLALCWDWDWVDMKLWTAIRDALPRPNHICGKVTVGLKRRPPGPSP
jgi:hypothetical protein